MITDRTCHDFFTAFSMHLNAHYSRPKGSEKEQVREGTYRTRRLDSLSRLIIKNNSQNCAAVALVNSQWYFTANNYTEIESNIKKIFNSLRWIKTDKFGNIKSTKRTRDYLLENYLQSVQKKPRLLKRLRSDVRKFLSALKTHKIFTKTEIGSLLESPFRFFRNTKELHAELALITGLGERQPITLGVSKLCCKLCEAALSAIKRTYQRNIEWRGRHGNFYFAWKPHSQLLGPCFKEFVGKKAFNLYHLADQTTKTHIVDYLKDLDGHRIELSAYFEPHRGSVMLNSDSSAPASAETSPKLMRA